MPDIPARLRQTWQIKSFRLTGGVNRSRLEGDRQEVSEAGGKTTEKQSQQRRALLLSPQE